MELCLLLSFWLTLHGSQAGLMCVTSWCIYGRLHASAIKAILENCPIGMMHTNAICEPSVGLF